MMWAYQEEVVEISCCFECHPKNHPKIKSLLFCSSLHVTFHKWRFKPQTYQQRFKTLYILYINIYLWEDAIIYLVNPFSRVWVGIASESNKPASGVFLSRGAFEILIWYIWISRNTGPHNKRSENSFFKLKQLLDVATQNVA